MWVAMWVAAAKRYLRHLFSMDAIPWGATNAVIPRTSLNLIASASRGYRLTAPGSGRLLNHRYMLIYVVESGHIRDTMLAIERLRQEST
jgi:hypothetical protein